MRCRDKPQPRASLREWLRARARQHTLFDAAEDRLALLGAGMQHQPARALRNPLPQEQDAEAEHGADAEGGAPAPIRR